jgi:hypothetical protein
LAIPHFDFSVYDFQSFDDEHLMKVILESVKIEKLESQIILKDALFLLYLFIYPNTPSCLPRWVAENSILIECSDI